MTTVLVFVLFVPWIVYTFTCGLIERGVIRVRVSLVAWLFYYWTYAAMVAVYFVLNAMV